MKKIILKCVCLLCAISLFSCTGNQAETSDFESDTAPAETVQDTTSSDNNDVAEWKRPTYEELVEIMMREAKIVADFIRDNDFIYGHAIINPAVNWRTLDPKDAIKPEERIVACDRLVNWVMFRSGFIDQDYYFGIHLEDYFNEHGFQKVRSVNDLQAGDIVFVNPDANGVPGHVFICAGKNLRYDGGSDARINGSKGPQPFNEPVNNFVRAYRPSPDYMPHPSMLEIYEPADESSAKISENATNIFESGEKEGTLTISKSYEPGKEYGQYEFHLNLTSYSEVNDDSPWKASFVGARLPERRQNATEPGGIFIALRGENEACLYVGCGAKAKIWNEPVASVKLPENFKTAHKIVVVDTGDVIKYYMYTTSGEEILICTIRVSAEYDQIVVRNSDNNIIYAGTAVVNDSGYFGVWSHGAKTITSDIAIKAK